MISGVVCGVFEDSWIDALPEERDDNELRFFRDDEAESKCLFFRSVATTAMVDASFYNVLISYITNTILL
jgi:hypothetical protein